ncbi:MdtA/MuxA family multidrug efflux RND transporter periplasmic adaptor subunit [Alloalcanivorax mobilis]|uniref:MdtA/MuxA family multidrug efflux RND transporter periplasmic adaptor subunit n=1 Tax=Alloalcanivorax mobilis TaxID=2019569 RepID=UPI000B5B3CFA|nr:MdtA/MuxA family multidrug efflux RND transporter periplasmic adaptor subunit [Alloalcanivorax mobilis]ASK34931.1 multidrug transporter subunit MdtA [Alcanivorax sp. N3-2A]|tara:strand:- start:7573 stop:8742 length:1170 start_codon:yes stop_codon:yes gene_type:complete
MTDSSRFSLSGPARRRWLLAVVLVLVLVALWFLLWRSPTASAPAGRRAAWDGPVAVSTVAAEQGQLAVQVKSIGTVLSLNTVTVRSRVDGQLTKVHFEEGAEVEKGDLLAEIDPRPYQVALDQAQGQYQRDLAELNGAQEDLKLYRLLDEQDSIAGQQLNQQVALVNQLKGTVQTDKASVADARLQLSWTRIEAPISGRLGLRKVDAGNLVTSADTDGLVSITQMRPIAVEFTIPEGRLPELLAVRDGDQPLRVEALDRDESRVLATGVLTTLDNQIDTATGTLRLKARFDNEASVLFPNQFVNVRLRLKTLDDVVVIPSDAVQYGSQGTYVYLVQDGKATLRKITLGPVEGDRVAVEEGLEGGEQVVMEGLDRLREGREVVPAEGAGE